MALRHAFHHVFAAEQGGSVAHEFGHGPAIAGTLDQFVADDGDCLRIVQLQPPGLPAPGEIGCDHDHELFLLTR